MEDFMAAQVVLLLRF